MLNTNSTHPDIAYAHLTWTKRKWQHEMRRTRCENRHKSQRLPRLEYAKFLSEARTSRRWLEIIIKKRRLYERPSHWRFYKSHYLHCLSINQLYLLYYRSISRIWRRHEVWYHKTSSVMPYIFYQAKHGVLIKSIFISIWSSDAFALYGSNHHSDAY